MCLGIVKTALSSPSPVVHQCLHHVSSTVRWPQICLFSLGLWRTPNFRSLPESTKPSLTWLPTQPPSKASHICMAITFFSEKYVFHLIIPCFKSSSAITTYRTKYKLLSFTLKTLHKSPHLPTCPVSLPFILLQICCVEHSRL